MATGVIDDIYNNASAVYSYASLNHFAGAAGDDETAWVRRGDSWTSLIPNLNVYSYALSCIRCGFSENTGYLKQPINIPKQYINTSKPLPIHPLGENATHGPNNLLTSLNNPLTPLKPI